MKKTLISAAVAGVFAAGVAMSVHAADPAATTGGAKMEAAKEKCYGIAKAGKNDCKSASGSHSCAGQSKANNSPDDFRLVSKEECAKEGGKAEAPAAEAPKAN